MIRLAFFIGSCRAYGNKFETKQTGVWQLSSNARTKRSHAPNTNWNFHKSSRIESLMKHFLHSWNLRQFEKRVLLQINRSAADRKFSWKCEMTSSITPNGWEIDSNERMIFFIAKNPSDYMPWKSMTHYNDLVDHVAYFSSLPAASIPLKAESQLQAT